jgi:hypothetical protein
MAFQREPKGPRAHPEPPTNGWGYLPFVVVIAAFAAFAYWFFTADWEHRFQPTQKPNPRAGAALTDQRQIKEQPLQPRVNNPTEQTGATR